MPDIKPAKSLRNLINIRLALISLVILVLSVLVVIWQARLSVKNELESSLNLADQLIRLNFPSQNQKVNKGDLDKWLNKFVSLEQTRHLNIALEQADGRILSFAAKQKTAKNAAVPALFFSLISAQSPQIREQLTLQDGNQVNLIIKADPNDEIAEAWQESRNLILILLTMAAIIFFMVNLLFKTTFNSIRIIVDALKGIETGRHDKKLPPFPVQEYDQIAKAINHMNEVMVASQRQNQALTRHTLNIQEEERKHLAKELHDELGQSLTAIKVMAATIKKPTANTVEITDTIISICDHLLAVVRSMMRNLHPLVLSELGLKASLEDLINQWSQRQPDLRLTLNCPDNIDGILPPEVSIQIFRICQECLTNIIRHAEASAASIELVNLNKNLLQITIKDNGKGCETQRLTKNFGLLGIRERLKSLGGQLDLVSSPQQGLAAIARIPLK